MSHINNPGHLGDNYLFYPPPELLLIGIGRILLEIFKVYELRYEIIGSKYLHRLQYSIIINKFLFLWVLKFLICLAKYCPERCLDSTYSG